MIYLQEAFAVLIANKVRSLLTITGLIIGVCAVIAIQVLGASMAGSIDGLLGSMSDNSFIIFPAQTQRNMDEAAVKLGDIQAVVGAVPSVIDGVPLGGTQELIRNGHSEGRYRVSPESANPFNNLPLLYGRKIDADDVTGAANVAVISNDAYLRIFPNGGDPTGQSIYAGPNRFLIVGVLTPPKRGFLNSGFGGSIAIPWTTYVHRYLHGDTVFAARFVASDASKIGSSEVAVINELRRLRGKPDLQYQTFDKSQFSQGVAGVFNAMTFVVAIIGAVSLLVAGIGIMNIMLVSVAERTREIGVRKAIGARRSQVLAQFFIEALALCGIGCAIGWTLGVGIGAFVNNVAIIKVTGTVVPVPWVQTIATTVIFAVVVTLAFGTYPAFRAASLDPIEALRYE